MSEWAYCVLLLPPTVPTAEPDLEAAKRCLLRDAIAPAVAPRRWFFRRYALDSDPTGNVPHSLRLYIELLHNDSHSDLHRALLAAVATSGLQAHVHPVQDWGGNFRPEYGGPDAQAAMRDFCAEAAPAAVVERRDPVDMAQKHMALGRAPAWGIRHWWMWLREGPLANTKEEEEGIWQQALAARRGATPSTRPPSDQPATPTAMSEETHRQLHPGQDTQLKG